ncbi:hypothetical protein [Jeotgalicoccus sp. WY2]|uniref:hypothetical protein n=1 Tax=Jeotgalicoccus sp. WY2 TaxID=2708346 RepID=UPI0020218DF2|nr:hypothetical protein [Jeotgalicoccus sp. WY2]
MTIIVDILDYIALYLSETNSKLVVIFSNYELLDKVFHRRHRIVRTDSGAPAVS